MVWRHEKNRIILFQVLLFTAFYSHPFDYFVFYASNITHIMECIQCINGISIVVHIVCNKMEKWINTHAMKIGAQLISSTGFKIKDLYYCLSNWCYQKISVLSSNINEVIRPVLIFLFIYFFHDKISQVQKSTKKY